MTSAGIEQATFRFVAQHVYSSNTINIVVLDEYTQSTVYLNGFQNQLVVFLQIHDNSFTDNLIP